MSIQTIKPTATKPYSAPTKPMSPIATKTDVEGTTTPLVLPTSDPLVAGAIWNDTGVITISAG